MRKVICTTGLIVATVMFVASPLLAAWDIRQALKSADTVTLERRVDWPSVRASLYQSSNESQQVIAELTKAGDVPKASMWRRVIAATVPMLSSTAIDRYVTPKGAPQLYAWRQIWGQTMRPALGLARPRMVLAGTAFENTSLDKVLSLLKRVDRAAFTSPMRIELEMRDRYADHRRYRAVMELQGLTWRLTEVHVLTSPKPAEKTQTAVTVGS